MNFAPDLVIAGQTATGKTDLAVAIRENVRNVEIISADSMAVYSGLEVLSAVRTRNLNGSEFIRLTSFLSPEINLTLSLYLAKYRKLIKNMRTEGKKIVLVGGSHLYIYAAINNMLPPPKDNLIRLKLENALKEKSVEEMYAQLVRSDPQAAKKIDRRNVRRIVRALEVIEITGRRFSDFSNKESFKIPKLVPIIALTKNKEQLATDIRERLREQLQFGAIDEVRRLAEMGIVFSRTAMNMHGLKEILGYLGGQIKLEDIQELVVPQVLSFTKRQRQWLRRDPQITWFDVSDRRPQNLLEDAGFKNYLDQIFSG